VLCVGYKTRRLPVIVLADSTVLLEIRLDEEPVTGGCPEYRPPVWPPVRVTGRVTDKSDGKPLTGARLTIVTDDGWADSSISALCRRGEVSDARGNFVVDSIKRGSGCGYGIIYADADGYQTECARFTVHADTQEVCNVALARSVQAGSFSAFSTGSVVGRVFNGKEFEPLPGASVRLLDGGATVSTDGDGIYLMNGIAPGKHEIEISAPGFLSLSFVVEIKRGVTVDGRSFILREAGKVKKN
jgi:hypothetical protein